MLEQRIGHHLDFVKPHPLVQLGQPGGQSRRDKMHGMAASGEFLAQLRSDNAAAAVSWIDCDADVHRTVSSMQ